MPSSRVTALLILLLWPFGAVAGGICDGTLGCSVADPVIAAPTGPVAPVPFGVGPTDPQARTMYDSLTHLWRTEANGTCIGTLGAWHLTPKYIIAEGRMFEILSIQGVPPRIGLSATRVFDLAPATFTLTPISRDRLDIYGQVLGRPAPFAPSHYNVALQKCRRR